MINPLWFQLLRGHLLLHASALIADTPNLLWITLEDNNVQWVGC